MMFKEVNPHLNRGFFTFKLNIIATIGKKSAKNNETFVIDPGSLAINKYAGYNKLRTVKTVASFNFLSLKQRSSFIILHYFSIFFKKRAFTWLFGKKNSKNGTASFKITYYTCIICYNNTHPI